MILVKLWIPAGRYAKSLLWVFAVAIAAQAGSASSVQVQDLTEYSWSILESAIREGNPGVQERAVLAIGTLPVTERSRGVLLDVAGDPLAFSRAAALSLLGPDFINGLSRTDIEDLLSPSSHITVRVATLELLGDNGNPNTLGLLQSALLQDELILREVASGSLMRVGSPALSVLGEQLGSNREANRRRAAQTLGLMGDSNAIPLLRRALDDQSSAVRLAAASSLASLGDTGGADELYAAANTGNPAVSVEGAVKLISLGLPVDMEVLAATVYSPDPSLRATAIRIASQTYNLPQNPALMELVLSAAGDQEATVRRSAADTLASVTDERRSSALATLLEDPDPWVRVLAAEGLLAHGEPVAGIADAVTPVLSNQDATMRHRAIDVLASVADSSELATIQARLNDPLPAVRRTAARTFGRLADQSSIPVLTALLDRETSPEVMEAAFETLSALGADPALLSAYLEETQSMDIRVYAAKSILQSLAIVTPDPPN